MAFCGNCGVKVEDGFLFCSNCGAQLGHSTTNSGSQQQQQQQGMPNNGPMYTNGYPNQTGSGGYAPIDDVQQNKVMAVLAYFSWLVLIPIFAAPQSKFARFHANQGLVLAIVEVIYGFFQTILVMILGNVFVYRLTSGFNYSRGLGYGLIITLLSLVWILFSVLAILGIVNAVNGKEKELPIIGKIKILK